MEERENRKGPGVFYAVIGVATLVVAIIGATFAYFSVTLNSADNAVNGTTGQGAADKLTLEVTPKTETTGKLIPLKNATQMGTALTKSCVDDNHNTVCRVYEVKVTNAGDNSVRLKGTLNLTGSTNMKWKLITAANSDNASATVNGLGVSEIVGNVLVGNVAPDNVADYFLVVWLEETGNQQDAAEANETTGVTAEANTAFTGKVTFDAVDAAGNPTVGGLTATFGA